jgi:hypothetical protein
LFKQMRSSPAAAASKVKYRSSYIWMAEFALAADAPAACAVIDTVGFDHNMVQHALAQAGGNEQLAIDSNLNGDVRDATAGSSSTVSIVVPVVSFRDSAYSFGAAAPVLSFRDSAFSFGSAAPALSFRDSVFGFGSTAPALSFRDSAFSFGAAAPSLSFKDSSFGFDAAAPALSFTDSSFSFSAAPQPISPTSLSFTDHVIAKSTSTALFADGKLQAPAQLRVQIMRPLELMQAVAWFFARRSPGMKRHREESPPPLGHMLTGFSPCVLVRVMCGCVATACRRLATAPAGMHVMYRTTGRWAAWIMERVTRGRVRRVQVRLQRRACCAVRCACRASACVRCVFDACCRKRWLVLRYVAAHRIGCIKPAAAFIIVCRQLLPPALQMDPVLWTWHLLETALQCFAI